MIRNSGFDRNTDGWEFVNIQTKDKSSIVDDSELGSVLQLDVSNQSSDQWTGYWQTLEDLHPKTINTGDKFTFSVFVKWDTIVDITQSQIAFEFQDDANVKCAETVYAIPVVGNTSWRKFTFTFTAIKRLTNQK